MSTPPATHLPFELEISIKPEDIDLMGHVNNIVYLRWVQEAAVAHWQVIANKQEQESLLWMVIRHEIDYKRQAFLGDQIIAKTWVGGLRRYAFERHTELLRKSDGKILAKAITVWQPVDAVTKRAVKTSKDIQAKFSVS